MYALVSMLFVEYLFLSKEKVYFSALFLCISENQKEEYDQVKKGREKAGAYKTY